MPEKEIIEVDETENDEKNEIKESDHFESTYRLKPNENYDANDYHYETDKYGRIVECEGKLELTDDPKRNQTHQKKAGLEDRKELDDGGHIIAVRFNGSEKIDNIVAMDRGLNRGEYKKLENEWAKQLEANNQVEVEIKIRYNGESQRPTSISVKYDVYDQEGNQIGHGARRFKN